MTVWLLDLDKKTIEEVASSKDGDKRGDKRQEIEKMLAKGASTGDIMKKVDCSRQYVCDVRIRFNKEV